MVWATTWMGEANEVIAPRLGPPKSTLIAACARPKRGKEFALLEALMRAAPGYLSNEALLEQVWDKNADPFNNTVTVTAGRLRRRLGKLPRLSRG